MSFILKLLILIAFQHTLRSVVDGNVLFFLNFLSSFFLYYDHDHCTDKSICHIVIILYCRICSCVLFTTKGWFCQGAPTSSYSEATWSHYTLYQMTLHSLYSPRDTNVGHSFPKTEPHHVTLLW